MGWESGASGGSGAPPGGVRSHPPAGVTVTNRETDNEAEDAPEPCGWKGGSIEKALSPTRPRKHGMKEGSMQSFDCKTSRSLNTLTCDMNL